MIINSTEFNNLLNDSRIDVFFKHHPSGQGLHTVPVTVNLCRGAKTWHFETRSELLFWHLYLGRTPTHNCALSVSVWASASSYWLNEKEMFYVPCWLRGGNVLPVGSLCSWKKSQPCGETRSWHVLSSLTDKTFRLPLPHLNDKSWQKFCFCFF